MLGTSLLSKYAILPIWDGVAEAKLDKGADLPIRTTPTFATSLSLLLGLHWLYILIWQGKVLTHRLILVSLVNMVNSSTPSVPQKDFDIPTSI